MSQFKFLKYIIFKCSQVENGEYLEEVALTLYLQYCISRKFPELSQNFAVVVTPGLNDTVNQSTKDKVSRTRLIQNALLSSISIQYKVNICFN